MCYDNTVRETLPIPICKKGGFFMAKQNDYFGLSYIVSLILAIIPITSVICGIVTRFMEGKTVAGVVRLVIAITGVGSFVLWVIDLVMMILNKSIWRVLD